MFKQNLADLFGVSMYYCLTHPKSFIILAESILMQRTQVQYPLFAAFQKIGYFSIQIEVAWKRLATESFFYFRGHFPIFQGDIEPTFTLLLSCKQMLQPFKHNVVWAFLAKKWRHQTFLHSGFSGKIGKMECLRQYFNGLTTSYNCRTWLIRIVS